MSKKFDLAIMNPPYDKNLHLKILEKVIPHCEETINISPSSHLLNIGSFKNWKNEAVATLQHLKEVTFIDTKRFADLFNCGYGVTRVCIGKYDNQTRDWKKFVKFDIEKYEIYDKISSHKPSLRNKFKRVIELNEFGVPIRRLINDYQIVKNDLWQTLTNNPKKIAEGIDFKTKEERGNFKESLNCWPYLLMMNEFNDLNVAHLPFMPDYTKPWDNKRFCDYFNITGYISDTEAEPDSEWEEILNTMEKYK